MSKPKEVKDGLERKRSIRQEVGLSMKSTERSDWAVKLTDNNSPVSSCRKLWLCCPRRRLSLCTHSLHLQANNHAISQRNQFLTSLSIWEYSYLFLVSCLKSESADILNFSYIIFLILFFLIINKCQEKKTKTNKLTFLLYIWYSVQRRCLFPLKMENIINMCNTQSLTESAGHCKGYSKRLNIIFVGDYLQRQINIHIII